MLNHVVFLFVYIIIDIPVSVDDQVLPKSIFSVHSAWIFRVEMYNSQSKMIIS